MTAPDVQAATSTWYELAQRYATIFGVPDGGRYLNDWTNRVPAILEAHDALVARVEQLETALRSAQTWHEALDYDEALNVIDAALSRLFPPRNPGTGRGG